MRVNLDATRNLLERCRGCLASPKFVFASSLAVFGGRLPDPVPDDARITPQTSYGTQKAMAELLLSDMSRRGFIDGRALRLPTIVVRPGKPNRAASSFASGIIREPLAGVDAPCPVAPTTRMWVQSPAAVVENFIIAHEARGADLPAFRAINVPGISVGVGEMVEALRSVAGDQVAARVQWRYDEAVDRIVQTWPSRFDTRIGPALGMRAAGAAETSFEAHGYELRVATSDWLIAPKDRAMQEALLDGWLGAALEIAPESRAALTSWHGRRRAHVLAGRSSLTVGHVDLVGWL